MRRFDFKITIEADRLKEFEQWCDLHNVKRCVEVTKRSRSFQLQHILFAVRFRNKSTKLLFKLTWGGA